MAKKTDQASAATPTESQIRTVMSDWLGNLRVKDEGNYTHQGKLGIRGNDLPDTASYLLGDVSGLDELDLMRRARSAAQTVANAIVSRNITLMAGPSQSFNANVNGREVISLATDFFDDGDLSNKNKCGIFLGLACHEAAHSEYTDKKFVDSQMDTLEKKDPQLAKLRHEIWNTLEDEMIEWHLGEDRPGFAEFVGKTKEYYFKKLLNDLTAEGKEPYPSEPVPHFLATLLQAIRYPSQMRREDVERCFDDLDEARRILTPYPLTTRECWEASGKILELIRSKVSKDLQQKANGQGGTKGQPQSGSSGQGTSKKSPSQSDVDKALREALDTEQGKRVCEAMRKDSNKTDAKNASGQMGDSEAGQYVNDESCEREAASGAGAGNVSDAFVNKPEGNLDAYNRALSAVRPYIPAMAKVLSCKARDNDYVLLGQRSGKLNTNKLVAFKAGNENIFTRRGESLSSQATICMLVDESGSMSGVKLTAAREAAVLVNEAVKRIPNVTFFCYGYTTGNRANSIRVYSENGREKKWALGSTVACSGTPTGGAMEVCSRRLRRFTQAPCLMLVLTDGQAGDRWKVIEQDKLLREQGIFPIGVGILHEKVRETFRDHVVMNDIANLPFLIGQITKGRLDKMLTRTDTLI